VLARATHLKVAKPGTTLVRQGERARVVLLLMRGELAISKVRSAPRRQTETLT